jgi:hypothetical protein
MPLTQTTFRQPAHALLLPTSATQFCFASPLLPTPCLFFLLTLCRSTNLLLLCCCTLPLPPRTALTAAVYIMQSVAPSSSKHPGQRDCLRAAGNNRPGWVRCGCHMVGIATGEYIIQVQCRGAAAAARQTAAAAVRPEGAWDRCGIISRRP